MRVAVAQIRCDAVDDEGRRDTTVAAIEAAAGDGAALVVLPELAACGYRVSARHLGLRAEPGDGTGQVHVAAADQVGEQDGFSFLGRSVVVDPFGQVLEGPLSPFDEAVVTVDLDLDAVERAQHRGPGIAPRENRRTDVYDSLLGYRFGGPT
jgi:predicted amidohydrolase